MSKFKVGDRVLFDSGNGSGVIEYIDPEEVIVPYLLSVEGGSYEWVSDEELEAVK